MKQIKFRVWIEKYKEFKYWGFIDNVFIGPPTGSNLSIQECLELSEQSLGISDKNEHDIYEGDFFKQKVDINTELHGKYAYYEFVFKNGIISCSYLCSQKKTGIPRGYLSSEFYEKFDGVDMKTILFADRLIVSDCAIIGNIHENKDLLKNIKI